MGLYNFYYNYKVLDTISGLDSMVSVDYIGNFQKSGVVIDGVKLINNNLIGIMKRRIIKCLLYAKNTIMDVLY